MRKYYIYKQECRILEIKEDIFYSIPYNRRYKIIYEDFKYFKCLIGAQAVYDFLLRAIIVTDFDCDKGPFWTDFLYSRYIIIDDKNRIRDFKELTKNVNHHTNRRHSWHPYQSRHSFKIRNELKQTLTKEDIDLCREYGVNIKPIRDKRKQLYNSYDWYAWERPSRKGRSWKEQSKRKHQWKNIKNF